MHREVLCAAMDFVPLALSVDDHLPTDIELVMGYDGIIAADALAGAFRDGLEDFPHLTGVICGGKSIIPAQGEIWLESTDCDVIHSLADLRQGAYAWQSRQWIPASLPIDQVGSLWQARLSTIPRAGVSVIGMRVSHAVLDGAGLAWFIHQCTAAVRGGERVQVCHDRRATFSGEVEGHIEPPHGYGAAAVGEGSLWSGDELAKSTPLLVAVSVDRVVERYQARSVLDARLRLAAWLCSLVAECQPQTKELALWCDARGMNDVPVHYTGNAGCFLHFALRGQESAALTDQLKHVATRRGFARIADTYRRLKQAEAAGRPFTWLGLEEQVLALNLVPHVVGGTDFGVGLPRYAMLLSRNSSGIRMAFTPDAAHLMIELSLAESTNQYLLEKIRAHELVAELWCDGRDSDLDA